MGAGIYESIEWASDHADCKWRRGNRSEGGGFRKTRYDRLDHEVSGRSSCPGLLAGSSAICKGDRIQFSLASSTGAARTTGGCAGAAVANTERRVGKLEDDPGTRMIN